MFKLCPLTFALNIAILSTISQLSYAQETIPEAILPTIEVIAIDQIVETNALYEQKASDIIVKKEKLQKGSATLGNALAGELGVHSSPFGGGASAPVIRGQDGVRIKILQNGTDVIDMSALSPDHVIATDTLLANQIELVRGTSTLLYSTASPAGVVNVIDKRIPTHMPEGNYNNQSESEALIRYNNNNDEKVIMFGTTLGLGKHFALRLEGLKRQAHHYHVPEFQSDVTLNYLPDSQNKSAVGTLGLSWIGENGYIGVAYNQRQDKYGIPGHNHHYDSCRSHFIYWTGNPFGGTGGRYYLTAYPHLMDDLDIIDYPHFDGCQIGEHGDEHGHSHTQPFGFEHNHQHGGPWVDMKSKRYDIRSEWKEPIIGLDKIKLSLSYADYFHDERDPANPEKITEDDTKRYLDFGHPAAIFKNKGFNSRLELFHTPTQNWKGMLGVQYSNQKASATTPYLPSYGATAEADPRHLLVPHTQQNMSIFGLEQYQINSFIFELAGRYEHQNIQIHYDHNLLNRKLNDYIRNNPNLGEATTPKHPNLNAYKNNAFSYSGTIYWDTTPNYRLSFTASHNERFPTPMELYYNGKHLATNSFEHGNKALDKEKSNNFEMGIQYTGDKFNYKASTYYNDFSNYIFNQNIEKKGNLYLRRYNQTTAKFYGLEGELNYQFTPNHQITLFGDIVRGKIGQLEPVIGKKIFDEQPEIDYDNLDTQCLLNNTDLNQCVKFLNQPSTPPVITLDESCNEQDILSAPDVCVLAYPKQLGTDILLRTATNAPRVPPARLGLRYHGLFREHWSINLELNHIFKQNKVSTSTIAIKPGQYSPAGCDPNDKTYCTKKDYYHPDNPLLMQARRVQENTTQNYTVFNIGLDYQNTWNNIDYTFSVSANNILNEKIYIHNSFLPYTPQMGRNFILGLNFKF